MKKRILWLIGVAAALALTSTRAYGIEQASCNAVVASGVCSDVVPGGAYKTVYVTIQCPTSSTSEVVIESKYCASCSYVRFPKVGDPPITNIGSIPNKPSRTFKMPAGVYAVRGNVLTWGAGAVTVLVDYE